MLSSRVLLAAVLLAGCSSSHGGAADSSVGNDLAAPDMAVQVPEDLASAPDLSAGVDLGGDMASPPLPAGPFGVWLLDGDATDSSGNGNNGTVVGTWTSIPNRHGVTGKALSFDGATQINFGTTMTSFSTALSVSFWIDVNAGATADNGNMISECTGNKSPYTFSVSNDNLWMVSGGGSDVLHVFADGNTGWVHVVVVWDISGGTVVPYINGVQGTSTAFTMTTYSGTNLVFGQRGGLTYYNGYLDDVRMYDRLLTSDEVAALYAE